MNKNAANHLSDRFNSREGETDCSQLEYKQLLLEACRARADTLIVATRAAYELSSRRVPLDLCLYRNKKILVSGAVEKVTLVSGWGFLTKMEKYPDEDWYPKTLPTGHLLTPGGAIFSYKGWPDNNPYIEMLDTTPELLSQSYKENSLTSFAVEVFKQEEQILRCGLAELLFINGVSEVEG